MEMYWIGFYLDEKGNRVRGNWKTTEDQVNEEANSYLYQRQLGLTLLEKGKIEKSKVEAIASEQKCSVSDVLSSL